MDAQDWADLASVYRAGAGRARGWVMNIDRQQDAEILDAQAERCEEIARDRAGNPPVTHQHYHQHTRPARKGRRVASLEGPDVLIHDHGHDHAQGETDHGHDHDDHDDPFRDRRW